MQTSNCQIVLDMKTASRSHYTTFKIYSDSNYFVYCYHPGASYCHLLQYLPSYFIFLLQSLIPWSLSQYCSSSDLIWKQKSDYVEIFLLNTLWWLPLSPIVKASQCLSLHESTSSGPFSLYSSHTSLLAIPQTCLHAHLRDFGQLFPLPALLFQRATWLAPFSSSGLCSNPTFSESKTLIFLMITEFLKKTMLIYYLYN